MPRKYLVTGGSGFIGAALVKRLLAEGHFVRSLDNNSRGANRRFGSLSSAIDIREGDIRDSDAVMKAAQGMDSIVHLAYINGTEFFYQKPELVLDVAVRGMLNVLDACRQHRIGDLVLASSSEVYQTPPIVPTDETVGLSIPDPLNPRYSYGGGKLICELMAINYGRKDFDRVTVFRPHNVFGPDMGWEHVIPQFILRAQSLANQYPEGALPFDIQGDGSQTRAFIYIDDFTDGVMKVIEKAEHLSIYHIGNPQEVTIAQVASKVAACFDRDIKLIAGSAPLGGTPRRCPDISKLKALGFKPNIDFDTALATTLQWYVNHSHLRQENL